MADIQSLASSDENGPKRVVENRSTDDFKLVAEIAPIFGVHIRSVYRAVRSGEVRSDGRRPMRVSVSDYHKYRKVHGVRGQKPMGYYDNRGPDETEREVLRLKAEGKSDSAIGRQVFGYYGSTAIKRVRKIVEVFECRPEPQNARWGA